MKPSMIFYPWKQIRRDLIQMVDLFTEDELDFCPFPGSLPVGNLFLKIAEIEDYWIHVVVRKELPADIHYDLSAYPSLRAVKSKLTISHERTFQFLDTLKEPDLDWRFKFPDGSSKALFEVFWHVIESELHYRGIISAALGMLGHKTLIL